MRSRTDNLRPRDYAAGMQAQHAFHAEFLKRLRGRPTERVSQVRAASRPRTDEALMRFETEQDERFAKALLLMKNQIAFRLKNKGNHEALRKAGISTQSGFNFYDLRPLDLLDVPGQHAAAQLMAREGPVNAGVGTARTGRAPRMSGTQAIVHPRGLPRPVRTPNEVDFTVGLQRVRCGQPDDLHRAVGRRGLRTTTWRPITVLLLAPVPVAGRRGHDSARQLRNRLCTRALQATVSQPGTPATPALSQSATSSGTFSSGNAVAVSVVMLSSMGYPATNQYGNAVNQSVAGGGLIPSVQLSSAVGEQYTMAGGTSAMSALGTLSGGVTGSNNTVTATVANKPGAFGFAWFVFTNATPILANAYLYAITTVPTVTITAAASGAAQAANAVGLNADNSATALQFSGLISQAAWAANNYTWSKGGSQWNDLGGASFTAAGHGQVKQLEDAFEYAFANWQTGYTDIWCSHDVARSLSAAILASGSAYTGVQIMGAAGTPFAPTGVVNGYPNRYAVDSPNGAGIIPIRTHPMMPPGTMYLALNKNPYPQSRIGNVLAALIQRDYYSIQVARHVSRLGLRHLRAVRSGASPALDSAGLDEYRFLFRELDPGMCFPLLPRGEWDGLAPEQRAGASLHKTKLQRRIEMQFGNTELPPLLLMQPDLLAMLMGISDIVPSPLAAPTPTVAAQGVTGSTTCTYIVAALSVVGQAPCAAVSIANANSAQTGANFNQITWGPVQNALGYAVYRTAGGGSQGLIAIVPLSALIRPAAGIPVFQVNDTGLEPTLPPVTAPPPTPPAACNSARPSSVPRRSWMVRFRIPILHHGPDIDRWPDACAALSTAQARLRPDLPTPRLRPLRWLRPSRACRLAVRTRGSIATPPTKRPRWPLGLG